MSKSKTPSQLIWKFLSGMGLATFLLVLLGIQTWLATLEMVDAGLLATLQKYFHWTSWYVLAQVPVPYFDRHLVVPMPGGYWVCAFLLLNMTLGGIIRIRKSWKTAGVVVAHFGIIFMVAAGGVAQLFEERGVMFLFEGEKSDYAVSLTDPTIEVLEIKEGKVVGEVHVAGEPELRGLGRGDSRTVRFAGLPIDLELTGWMRNASVVEAGPDAGNAAIDGWTLRELPVRPEGELNAPACYARVVYGDGSKGSPFILAVPQPTSGLEAFAPVTVEADGRKFAVRMVKQTIPVPYVVQLDDAIPVYFPNSTRPKSFRSKIRRIDEEEVPVEIFMNEPMRRGGYTFFQRTMSSGPQQTGGPEFSGFEVVSNPADQWPKWSLWVVATGMGVHFLMKLFQFILGSTKPRTPSTP
ncbi:cytochrome c biogenesis protein ResB [Haloferula helveola]